MPTYVFSVRVDKTDGIRILTIKSKSMSVSCPRYFESNPTRSQKLANTTPGRTVLVS